MRLSAIIWDYDGTLVDSYARNFAVTRDIFNNLNLGFNKSSMPVALQSIEEYKKANQLATNWRDLYTHYFGLTQEQTDKAGLLWSKHQKKSSIKTEIFENIPAVVQALGFIPHGICSQNCSKNIKEFLDRHNIGKYFKSIIGYKDISLTKQKPNPAEFMRCFEAMQLASNNHDAIIYIGDHEQDMQFARNAEQELKKQNRHIRVLGVAACYNGSNMDKWQVKPNYHASVPSDIIGIVRQVDKQQFSQYQSGEDV